MLIRVVNDGDRPLPEMRLEPPVPKGWVCEPKTMDIPSIRPGGFLPVKFELNPGAKFSPEHMPLSRKLTIQTGYEIRSGQVNVIVRAQNRSMETLRDIILKPWMPPGYTSDVIPLIEKLTPDEVDRYSRHIIMPQVGSEGQRKLINSSILVIGAGGLGSPAALYLALAGVGKIGIADFDVVDRSNLQRQVLHRDSDIGKRKVVSAMETLKSYNPNVEVVMHDEPINSSNALQIINNYDGVINGADNFPTRYLICDATFLLKKPLFDGSVLMFDGQVTTYVPGKNCYRCVFPDPPPPGSVPSCSEAGVIGALPGLVGSIQAIEAVKYLLGVGDVLDGRMILIDALSMEFRTVKIRRDDNCALCGDDPKITELIDYEVFCGMPAVER